MKIFENSCDLKKWGLRKQFRVKNRPRTLSRMGSTEAALSGVIAHLGASVICQLVDQVHHLPGKIHLRRLWAPPHFTRSLLTLELIAQRHLDRVVSLSPNQGK